MRKRKLILFGLPLLLLLGGLAFYALVFRSSPAAGFTTGVVKIGDIEQTVLATGKLKPKELVNVGAQVSGQVTRLHVALGQSVRAGDPIADIDAQPQQQALRAAQAGVDALRAQRSARAATLIQAELAFKRQQMMLAADATARADYEAARATLDAARNDVKGLDAQIVQARTQADIARTNLGYTRIVAPMDGVVVAVVTKQGQTLNSFQSAPTIVMLAKLDVMTVRAEISEADIEKVRPGQTVWFTTMSGSERRHYARIEKIEPAPESIVNEGTASTSTSGTQASTASAIYYIAQFDVPNSDRRLRPSMTAQVSVLLAKAKRAILVPAAAVIRRDSKGHATVKVVGAGGKLEERPIMVGIGDDTNIVVRSGLRPGDKVALVEAAPAAAPSDVGMDF